MKCLKLRNSKQQFFGKKIVLEQIKKRRKFLLVYDDNQWENRMTEMIEKNHIFLSFTVLLMWLEDIAASNSLICET